LKLVGKSKKRRRAKRRIIIIVVFLSILLTGAVSGFVAMCYYADSLDTVFPNVWAEGVDLSGLTRAEAVKALIDDGYESSAVGIAITVTFPDESSFSATGDDVGLALNASEAVNVAYNFGRDDTFFKNGMTYIKALFNDTQLIDLSSPNYNDSILRQLSDEYTYLFNQSLYENNLDVTGTQITIIKGTGILPADADDVFNIAVDLMRRAILQHEHLHTRYIPEERTDDIIDLVALHEYIHVDAISSIYDRETMGGTPSSSGKTFDLDVAIEKLENAEFGATIVIPILILEPAISQDEVESMLFRDILGERTTSQGSSVGRSNNIRLAAGFINGTILQPGETFSYNSTVGRRTEARGFMEAPGIVGGRLVPSIGGGVCQVSSTIYGALLFTDLEIVSRRNHSLTVGYIPYGQDATVATDLIDFKFKNNSDFPIRIESTTSGGITVNVKIYGTRVSDVYYVLPRSNTEITLIDTTPVRIVEVESEDVSPGDRVVDTPGQVGYVVETWKLHVTADGDPILDANGNQMRTFVTRDTYRMQDRLILIGPPIPEYIPPPPPADYDTDDTSESP